MRIALRYLCPWRDRGRQVSRITPTFGLDCFQPIVAAYRGREWSTVPGSGSSKRARIGPFRASETSQRDIHLIVIVNQTNELLNTSWQLVRCTEINYLCND